ncbi:hypothetical protein [Sporosarcina sp. 6E9]|uniref:hypothetical protein n=1 Tax=Sporosarcina sp. 6E9 TaxID=2819235 RepID=UPI001AD20762|nr:hypothetical protein [Sporosarcina sp. 6E9]MBO1910717.1 hypothetical protein [Microvirga sp. 3-52]
MVGIIITLIFLFCFILFRNGIELNNVTTEFTILFVASSLIILLFWKVRNELPKKIGIGICTILILQLGVISLYAYDRQSNQLINEQNRLLVILGNSSDYQQLNLSFQDIDKVYLVGDAKKGSFNHPFDYRIELKVKSEDKVYQFQCKGQGPWCKELGLINAK